MDPMDIPRPVPFGNYLLIERIGIGGTAEILRAVRRGRRPGEPEVAVKRLIGPMAEDPACAQLFIREIGALARIDHPCVVKLLDQGEAAGLPFLVMPLLDGCTLRDLLRDPLDPGNPQPMPAVAALWLAAEVASGLAAAHRAGVVHRDVSPTNVQVTAAGEVQVLDFGIARVAGLAQTTHGQGLRGKWAYLSPEQIAGEPLDGKSDLFSLGTVLVEMLQGTAPFAGSDRQDTLGRIQTVQWSGLELTSPLRAELEPMLANLETLLADLFARQPDRRPADGDTVAARLCGMLGQALALDLTGLTAHGRELLARRVALVDRRPLQPLLSAAELRGEVVTDPALDPDVTAVRLRPDDAPGWPLPRDAPVSPNDE